jgi:hypothetical protein
LDVEYLVEHIPPHNHVGGEKEWLDVIEEGDVHGSDDGEQNNDRHGRDDRPDGIIGKTREQ